MIAKFYLKLFVMVIIGSFLFSCAPKYTAHFQQKSYKMDRYEIEDVERGSPVLFTDAEQEMIRKEIEIKEIVVEPKKVDALMNDAQNEVIKPKNTKELINVLKANPNATIALDLDRQERKALKREVKEQFKAQKESAAVMQNTRGESKLLYYILAVLLPPLAVGLWRGIGSDFWINILLTLLLWLPGVIHAIIVISSKPKMTQPASY